MSKNIAISFEENNIKIVYASLKGNHIYIDKTEIITEPELDYFLQKEKAREFIVTYNFSNSYHGVLKIPVVKTRYIKKIIESEIRKATNARDFSFIYTLLGERIIENKKVLDVFYFAVRTEEIQNVIERFYSNGKIVKALYPSVFPVASLLKFKDEPIVAVLGTGRERIAFLTKNGAIYFIRNFQSLVTTLSDLDIQDINMTINYCFQNIRINPSLVLLTGALSESSSPRLEPDISTLPSAPLACLYKNDYIHCSKEIFNEFIIPIASFYAPRSSNILSKEFKNVNMVKNYMVTTSRVFVVLTLLCLAVIFYETKNIIDMKNRLQLAQKNNSDIENMFSEYTAKEAEINRYRQLVDFLNTPSPSIQKLLITLAELDVKDLIFNSIEARAKDSSSFLVTINGMSAADTYASMQTSFKDISDALDKMEDIEITSKIMDLENKTFIIEINYYKE